ncbi:MAG: methionyl-tRNA formyltransferase [Oscillospiraceae bacterium]|nr:methionyl-tRNA formyltransferase [Oscillospiraceae bacterium]
MNIIFMGTPDFAVPALEKLVASEHNVTAVFTQPDKPRGRKMVLTPPEVKACALKHGIKVYQPDSLKDGKTLEIIKDCNPDVIVVAAYGKILPKEILDYPKYGCVNIHGSLLPKYRGAAPIQRAVLDGESETGVTTMQMAEGLDTGDMLLVYKTPILPDETSGELFDRLALAGADLLLDTLEGLEKGEIVPQKQNDSLSSYANMIDKSMCPIDFNKTAQAVHNQVRGLNPWPVATAQINGKRLKIYKTKLSSLKGNPGEVISLKPLTVACKENSVEIITLQPEGKKIMDSKAYLTGNKISLGDKFD